MTSVEVVSVYDQRTVSGKPPDGTTMTLDGETMAVSRVVAIYRRSLGEPWELGLVKLAGATDDSTDDTAILIRSADWPQWLVRFVDDNMPTCNTLGR